MNIQDRFRDPRQHPSLPQPARPALKRARRRPLVAIGLAAALVLAGGYLYWIRSGTSDTAPVLASVQRGDVEDVVTALGSLQPITSVDVGAQVSGQLKRLFVKIGDDVEKGQLLAEIDSAVFAAKVDAGKAQLESLQAQLAERQSSLALAEAQADRQSRLMNDNATSQDAYDLAEAALKSARAQVKSVQAQINQAQSSLKADEATLGYSNIYAPIAGTVTAIVAKEGQTLNANQQTPTILTVADLSTMTVSTQVSEADVPKLALGMDAYFTTLGDPGRRWSGKLRQILPTPTVVNNVVLFTALFDVENENKTLMPQMTAQVFFVRGAAHDAVVVPVASLRYANGGRQRGAGGNDVPGTRSATVTVVKADGTQDVRNVTVGVSDRVTAEIVSGLAEGETVIAGSQRAAPGAQGRGGAGGLGGAGRGLGGFR